MGTEKWKTKRLKLYAVVHAYHATHIPIYYKFQINDFGWVNV